MRSQQDRETTHYILPTTYYKKGAAAGARTGFLKAKNEKTVFSDIDSMKKKKKKAPEPPKSKATIIWPVLAFLGLGVLALYQYSGEINLCSDGAKTQATVKNITTTQSEDHHYGRNLKIFNVELGYTLAGKTVSVIKTFNDGEVGKLFLAGKAVGDNVSILIDEDNPKRFKLASECRK